MKWLALLFQRLRVWWLCDCEAPECVTCQERAWPDALGPPNRPSRTPLGSRLRELRSRIVASGTRLLSLAEVERARSGPESDGEPSARLDRLLAERFPTEGKEARVERAMAALRRAWAEPSSPLDLSSPEEEEDDAGLPRWIGERYSTGGKSDGTIPAPDRGGEKERLAKFLDPGIRAAVFILRDAGVQTFASCQGGPGHWYPNPIVEFDGEDGEGFRALGVALSAGLPVLTLQRTWPLNEKEPTGPWWTLTFRGPLPQIPNDDPGELELLRLLALVGAGGMTSVAFAAHLRVRGPKGIPSVMQRARRIVARRAPGVNLSDLVWRTPSADGSSVWKSNFDAFAEAGLVAKGPVVSSDAFRSEGRFPGDADGRPPRSPVDPPREG